MSSGELTDRGEDFTTLQKWSIMKTNDLNEGAGMLSKLKESKGACLGIQISGKVTTEEIDEIIKELEDAIEKHGMIRLLVQMKKWKGMEAMAAFDDFHFLIRHIKDIEVLAVVGDRFWEKLWLGFGALFVKTRTKFFEEDEYEFAWTWIKGVPPRE